MKTKITVTIAVEVEGQPPETFKSETPPCFNLRDGNTKHVFPATVTVLEGVLSSMHRRYLPTVEEAMEHNQTQSEDRKAPDDDGTR